MKNSGWEGLPSHTGINTLPTEQLKFANMAEETDILIADEHQSDTGSWDGGDQKPFKASYGKLMMWYFLLSDAFTFAGFLIAYGALRFSSPAGPYLILFFYGSLWDSLLFPRR
jgi:hypothetical protein